MGGLGWVELGLGLVLLVGWVGLGLVGGWVGGWKETYLDGVVRSAREVACDFCPAVFLGEGRGGWVGGWREIWLYG